MIKNVIFDIGNVLVGFTVHDLSRILGSSEEGERLRTVFFSKPWRDCDRGIITIDEQIERTCALSPDDAEVINYVIRNRTKMFRPLEKSREVVKDLKKAGFGVYYLSDTSFDAFDGVKKILDYFDLFNGGAISCAEKCAKSDPDLKFFNILFERYKLDPKECVFVDDSEANILAAKKTGLNVVHLTDPELIREELKKFDELKDVL